jgi:hypothetical protein
VHGQWQHSKRNCNGVGVIYISMFVMRSEKIVAFFKFLNVIVLLRGHLKKARELQNEWRTYANLRQEKPSRREKVPLVT